MALYQGYQPPPVAVPTYRPVGSGGDMLYRAPQRANYSGLLNPTTGTPPASTPIAGTRPAPYFQQQPGMQFANYNMGSLAGSRTPSGPAPGFEQYLDTGFGYGGASGAKLGYKRIFHNGRWYNLPPGVQPPADYQEPSYNVGLY